MPRLCAVLCIVWNVTSMYCTFRTMQVVVSGGARRDDAEYEKAWIDVRAVLCHQNQSETEKTSTQRQSGRENVTSMYCAFRTIQVVVSGAPPRDDAEYENKAWIDVRAVIWHQNQSVREKIKRSANQAATNLTSLCATTSGHILCCKRLSPYVFLFHVVFMSSSKVPLTY